MDSEKIKSIAPKILIGILALSLIVLTSFYVLSKRKAASMAENWQSEKSTTNLAANDASQNQDTGVDHDAGSFSDRLKACQNDPEKDFAEDMLKDNDNYYYSAGLVVGMKAMAGKDISLCDKYFKNQDNKSICSDLYYVFMHNIESSSINVCDKIKDKELAVFCKINFGSKDTSLCASMIADYNKAYCNAIISGDKNICATLSAEDKGQCEDNFFLVRALQEKKFALCDEIKIDNRGGLYNKAYCEIILSPVSQKKWSDFYTNNVCMNKYTAGVAKEKNDIYFCDNISQKDRGNQELYQSCKKQF